MRLPGLSPVVYKVLLLNNKFMKLPIKIIIFISIFTFLLSGVYTCQATEPISLTDKLGTVGAAAQLPAEPSLAKIIGAIVKGLLSLVGVIFLVLVIYGGYLWMIARGNEEEVKKAKDIIRGSIIGLVVVLAAYAITAFVVSRLTEATGYNQTSNYPYLNYG